MKSLICVLFFVLSSLASAKTYFVSPNGTDGIFPSRGTYENPWKTWNYAFNHVTPGDTVYFRGGVYQPYSTSRGAKLSTTAVDGTRINPTCFFAYPDDWAAGNYPILDCQTMYGAYIYGIEISRASNIYFKGLHVRNVRQTIAESWSWNRGWMIWSENNVSQYHPNNIRLENCVAYNIGGPGISKQVADTAYFINCDVYNNCDTLTLYDPGGSGSGFGNSGRPSTQNDAENAYTYYYGCRTWNCSDQGFANTSEGTTVYDNCWAINNGNNPFPTNVDNKGSGWKFWFADYEWKNPAVVQVTMRNNIGAHNAFTALNWTDMDNTDFPEIRAHIYNNFFYDNTYEVYNWGDAWGYNIMDDNNPSDSAGYYDHLYYNNLSYVNPYRRDLLDGATNGSNNLFNVIGTPVTDDYFISLDTTGMLGVHTRKADGSLPDTDFGKPAPGSPLIDAGVQVFGIPFNGSAPDIGWAEYASSTSTPAAPVYVSSVIQNATPARLEITFNLTLANIIPAASAFTVTVNSSARTVSSVSVSGTKVLLTLASPVLYGNTVTVAYTKPASNPIQTAAGGQAASFTAKNVTNNVAAVIPVYVSSVVENVTPARIDLTFNLTLANIVPAASAFIVTVNGSARAVSSVSVSGTKVLLTLASPVIYGNTVTVAYTKPASNPIQTASGGQAASFTAKSVTNNVAAVIPAYVSSVVENATPARIDLTFNLTLANIVPAASAFSVTVNGAARTVSSVSVSGTIVVLTLASPVVYGNTVTVAYTKPASNPIQTATGGQAASFTAKNVTNYVGAVNQPPSVNISSPTKSTSFVAPATITIEAVASDPDGSVIKVEFYQGAVKLGELTSAPYSFTWKEVPEGTYSITAAATDNQNLRTVSTSVTVVVEKSSTQLNQLPEVAIKIPNNKKPKKHDNIVIVAEASDPDGTVAKVVLKSGDVIIAEMTTSPYVYTMMDADTGTYQFTAIAIDNLGATSISQTIELRVYDFYDENSEIVRLFPNPNKGQFKIDILTVLPEGNNRISIFNSSGMIIYNKSLPNIETPTEIDLDQSAPGTYILMITSGGRIIATKKFIINR